MSGPEAGAARGEDIFEGAGDGLLWYPYPDYDEKISGYVKRRKERKDADQ